jgi:hypothetical protein
MTTKTTTTNAMLLAAINDLRAENAKLRADMENIISGSGKAPKVEKKVADTHAIAMSVVKDVMAKLAELKPDAKGHYPTYGLWIAKNSMAKYADNFTGFKDTTVISLAHDLDIL